MRKIKRIILWLSAVPVVLIAGVAWLLWGGISNPAGRKTIGEITPPVGFQRVEVEPGSFGAYLREFPLQGRGSHMKYFDGSLAHGQYFGYAVLNLPMISENEQCCDAVQNASFCKVLQAVLSDEAKCLGVYHHVNKKCRNEENKKKMRGLSYFLLFLLSYFLLSQSWAAVMSDSRTVVACLTRCSSRVSTKAGGS